MINKPLHPSFHRILIIFFNSIMFCVACSHLLRFFLCLILLCGFAGNFLSASRAPSAPSGQEAFYLINEEEAVGKEWKMRSARMALESGLSGTAVRIYRSLLNDQSLGDQERERISLGYVAALIAQSKYDEADKVLSSISGTEESERAMLYAACIAYKRTDEADPNAVRSKLSEIDKTKLSPVDLPWYYLLSGVLAASQGSDNESLEFFKSAQDSAASPQQAALFSSLILRQKLLDSPTDEGLLVEIRAKFEALSGQAAAFPYLREYVVILHGLGREGEAIRVLEDELELAGSEYTLSMRATLLLLKGLILGPASDSGWSSLKELVRSGIDSDATMIALQLLGSVEEREGDLMVLLSEIISRSEPHPLIAQLYYMRCQLALADPATTALAEADASYLLEQFPGLSEITSVYRLLAYAAIQREPARYRVAADYLLELRDKVSEAGEVAQLNRLIGDCYFLNRDYANAADFYESGIAAADLDSTNAGMLLRLVISQVRAGKYEAALAKLDQAGFARLISHADRWRAEWTIALALLADEQAPRALERLRSLTNEATVSLPASLDLRLRWLEARISLQLGTTDGVSDNLSALLARIESMPEEALMAEESVRLKSELMLLQSKYLISRGNMEAAFEIIAKIRTEFPDSIAAQRSYFTGAAFYANSAEFDKAKQELILFVKDYPSSSLVPRALFEAALHCQRQGSAHYAEAVVLLDKLVKEYPASGLAYHSGLKQGDLLRLMNDFAGAQLIYENLINQFPTHELRYAAEFSLADSIAAMSQGRPEQLLEAAAILERLVDRPDIPKEVRIEAGYKWGNILSKSDGPVAAKTAYSLVASRYLLDPQNAAELTPVGRYWLSRTLFTLCRMLEGDGAGAEAVKLYRKLIAYNLPGRRLALSRINQLQLVETP